MLIIINIILEFRNYKEGQMHIIKDGLLMMNIIVQYSWSFYWANELTGTIHYLFLFFLSINDFCNNKQSDFKIQINMLIKTPFYLIMPVCSNLILLLDYKIGTISFIKLCSDLIFLHYNPFKQNVKSMWLYSAILILTK